MSLAIDSILDAVISHAMASGHFETVNGHEPKNAPGTGVTAAVWVETIGPVRGGSGLSSTTGRLTLNVRLYTPMLSEPQDAIDPSLVRALDALMTAYSGDFQLGGAARNIDLLGAHGTPLQAQAGYLSQDGKVFRVYTINLPVIVNDLWEQTP